MDTFWTNVFTIEISTLRSQKIQKHPQTHEFKNDLRSGVVWMALVNHWTFMEQFNEQGTKLQNAWNKLESLVDKKYAFDENAISAIKDYFDFSDKSKFQKLMYNGESEEKKKIIKKLKTFRKQYEKACVMWRGINDRHMTEADEIEWAKGALQIMNTPSENRRKFVPVSSPFKQKSAISLTSSTSASSSSSSSWVTYPNRRIKSVYEGCKDAVVFWGDVFICHNKADNHNQTQYFDRTMREVDYLSQFHGIVLDGTIANLSTKILENSRLAKKSYVHYFEKQITSMYHINEQDRLHIQLCDNETIRPLIFDDLSRYGVTNEHRATRKKISTIILDAIENHQMTVVEALSLVTNHYRPEVDDLSDSSENGVQKFTTKCRDHLSLSTEDRRTYRNRKCNLFAPQRSPSPPNTVHSQKFIKQFFKPITNANFHRAEGFKPTNNIKQIKDKTQTSWIRKTAEGHLLGRGTTIPLDTNFLRNKTVQELHSEETETLTTTEETEARTTQGGDGGGEVGVATFRRRRSQSAEEENIVQTKRTKRVRKEETDQQKKTAAETKERNKREKNIKKHTSILKKIKKSFETVFSAVTEVSQCLTKKVEIIPLLVALYNKQKAIDKREKDFYDKAETYNIIQKKSKTLWRNRACPNNQVFEDDDICLQALSRIVHWAAEVTREATASGQKRITESMQASNVLEHTQKEEQNSYNNCLKSFNDCAKKISISEHFKNFDYRSSFVSSK